MATARRSSRKLEWGNQNTYPQPLRPRVHQTDVRDHLLLRTEPATNNVADYAVNKAVDHLPELRYKLSSIADNYLDIQQDILETFLPSCMLWCASRTSPREARSQPQNCTPRSRLGHDAEDNLITLCWKCHQQIHSREIRSGTKVSAG
jgi:HNH endonuclease